MWRATLLFFLAFTFGPVAFAAGRLQVVDGWIRSAPPGAMMLAGYATLRNVGDAPLTINGARSDAFGEVSLHETMEVDGVAHMQALGRIDIAPGASVRFAPGGKHLMLMRPRGELKLGDGVKIRFSMSSGAIADADFVVREN
ncbi:MAG: copper chaperone PCu(A)C [Proteobacteria bacterium]|nr:copper chaperone PCu(A)C [Pseudomonadota bacterium]